MADLKICTNCGNTYKQCRSCEETYSKTYFAWRTKYCSPRCMFEDMEKILEGERRMRIEYDKKTYMLESYDFDKDEYITTNGIKLKANEISAFILSSEQFNTVLKHVPKLNAKKPVKKVNKEEVAE